MELLSGLEIGFATALTAQNLALAFVGCLLGTLIGVLPGIGPLATLAMLLPLTHYFPPESALIMLAGIYYGAQYGGSTTAILVNLPGENSSAVTCIEGHQMARNGRAGAALSVAALASFFAGSVATLAMAVLAQPLAKIALQFGPEDYFSLMLLGLIAATAFSNGSALKSLGMVAIGILLGLVGIDPNSGNSRFTLGYFELMGGLDFVAVAVGIFGAADIVANLMRGSEDRDVLQAKIGSLWPNRDEVRRSVWPTIRGTMAGILGVLPGGGALLSSFFAYATERKLSKTPERFGKGAVEGVAAPEAANNAGAQMSFIPMLTLGIPSNALMAMLIGAMMMQGVVPGPDVMTTRPEIVWGLIASMWIGNIMLVVINLPLVGLWVSMLRIPYGLLFPGIVLFCCIGAFSVANNPFLIYVTAVMLLIGFMALWLNCPPAPLALGFVLGPMLEENLGRALTMSDGDVSIFFTSTTSLIFLGLSALLAIGLLMPSAAAARNSTFADADD